MFHSVFCLVVPLYFSVMILSFGQHHSAISNKNTYKEKKAVEKNTFGLTPFVMDYCGGNHNDRKTERGNSCEDWKNVN